MLKTAIVLVLGLSIAISAMQADARSSSHRSSSHRSSSHRSASPAASSDITVVTYARKARIRRLPGSESWATAAKKACKAKCKSDYEIGASLCTTEPRSERKECRHLESLDRKQCSAACL